jgi:hypothetical protein
MTTEQLSAELERSWHDDTAKRVGAGVNIPAAEQMAVNAYLTPLARRVVRIGQREIRQARRTGQRYQQRDLASHVARRTEADIRDDERCGSMIATVGWLLLERILWHLAGRLALWLVTDDGNEDLICRMEGA